MILIIVKIGTKNKMHQVLQFKTAVTSPSTKASNIIKTGLFITVLLYYLFCSIKSKFLVKVSDKDMSS